MVRVMMSDSLLNILGVGVNTTNIPQLIDIIDIGSQSNKNGYITVTGVQGITESQYSAYIKNIYVVVISTFRNNGINNKHTVKIF